MGLAVGSRVVDAAERGGHRGRKRPGGEDHHRRPTDPCRLTVEIRQGTTKTCAEWVPTGSAGDERREMRAARFPAERPWLDASTVHLSLRHAIQQHGTQYSQPVQLPYGPEVPLVVCAAAAALLAISSFLMLAEMAHSSQPWCPRLFHSCQKHERLRACRKNRGGALL